MRLAGSSVTCRCGSLLVCRQGCSNPSTESAVSCPCDCATCFRYRQPLEGGVCRVRIVLFPVLSLADTWCTPRFACVGGARRRLKTFPLATRTCSCDRVLSSRRLSLVWQHAFDICAASQVPQYAQDTARTMCDLHGCRLPGWTCLVRHLQLDT